MAKPDKIARGKKRKRDTEVDDTENTPTDPSAKACLNTTEVPDPSLGPPEQDQTSKDDSTQGRTVNAVKKQQRFIVFIGTGPAMFQDSQVHNRLTMPRKPTLHCHHRSDLETFRKTQTYIYTTSNK
jgi:hypothetical protein